MNLLPTNPPEETPSQASLGLLQGAGPAVPGSASLYETFVPDHIHVPLASICPQHPAQAPDAQSDCHHMPSIGHQLTTAAGVSVSKLETDLDFLCTMAKTLSPFDVLRARDR